MRKGLLIAIIILMAGCSTKFTYNNLDWMIHWYIDDYISLTDSQEDKFNELFANWQSWHRNEELSRYIDHLKSLKADLQNETLVAAQIEKHVNDSRQHWERLRDHISPELVSLAKDLSDQQIESLFEELNEENEEIRESIEEFSEKSAEEQREERLENLEEGVSEFIGKLSKEQKAIVKQFADQFSSTRPMWLTYRESFQKAAMLMLEERKTNPNFDSEFLTLITSPEQFRSDTYTALSKENTQVNARMGEALFYTLSDKQKSKLMSKIDDMIADLEDLQSNE